MDAKDLRTESALSERNNDGSKYSQSGGVALHCDRNKSYHDIGSNSLVKVDVQSARPCAVIGPDRVVPPSVTNDAYMKKSPAEPWPCMDNTYHTRRPPEYPHKLPNYQNPTRNISPRQTFQENMQRIMVPPSYNSVKISEDTNYAQMSDRSNALPKNIKINVPPEAKFCDVPYTVYPTNNDQKSVRNPEMCLSNVNPTITRTAPHGWPPGSVNIRPTRTYGASELYQYQEYPSCAGPRPGVPRPNRPVPEEQGYMYTDPYYHQEGNIRFKPYPTVKERFPQQRYEYIGNYTNSFHPPPPFPTHKYEFQKTVPPHPYQPYPPIKYLDRVAEPVIEGYQRNQQPGYNMPYRNQLVHPNFGPVLGNCPQNKIHSYPPDAHIKSVGPNKIPYDNAKAYIEYENGRPKMYPPSESYLVNEIGRMHPMKSQIMMSNYPSVNMHNIPPNTYFKKDNQQLKNYEFMQAHYRSIDPNINIHNPMVRHPPVFSPTTLAISPSDSSASNDTSQTLGISQEDCGYVSQSSTASVRSVDSGINRISNDYLRKYYDSRFGPIIRTSPMSSKSELSSNHNSKEKKNIDVRQFLQMWNEGDEEVEDTNSKEIIIQPAPKNDNSFSKAHEIHSQPNQEQLYVLGLVNVPSEELGKYEHIQKISKLPENIKGYNHIELLCQFEEAIESSNMVTNKISNSKDFQMSSKPVLKQTSGVVPPRPLSPLDVEAKISQSVIHKEVGCNFEIKPCSPKMLNVEVATPVQNILAERAIEKVTNPVMLKSPRLNSIDDTIDCNIMKRQDHRLITNEPVRIPSCKMIKTQFSNNNSIDSIKNSYSLQDLESNSGLCLASLPRLDNDIELNFPEVNQQFINANKGDSVVSNCTRDLPTLEALNQSDSQSKDKLNDLSSLTQESDIIKSPCIADSEKEFSKLSKYRKAKVQPSDCKENLNAVRTDSVIIKNPENNRNYDDNSTFSTNSLNKQSNDVQPINLTSQGTVENLDITTANNKPQTTEEEICPEIAIDFSLNKNICIEKAECEENKNSTETEISIHKSNKTIISGIDGNICELPSFSICTDNVGHDVPHSISNSEFKIDPQSPNDESKDDTKSLEEILAENECLTPVPNDKDDSVSLDASPPNTNKVEKNSPLSVEFMTPTAEHLVSKDDNSDYMMEIDKSNVAATDFVDTSNILMEDDINGTYLKNHKREVEGNNGDSKDDITRDDDNMQVLFDKKKYSEVANLTNMMSQSSTDESQNIALNTVTITAVAKSPQKLDYSSTDLINEDLLDENINQFRNGRAEMDSELDSASSNLIESKILENQSQITEAGNDSTFDLPPINHIDKHIPESSTSETDKPDFNFNAPSPNNVPKHEPSYKTSETNALEIYSNFNLTLNNISHYGPTDTTHKTIERVISSNSEPLSSNIINHNTEDVLDKEIEDCHTKIGSPKSIPQSPNDAESERTQLESPEFESPSPTDTTSNISNNDVKKNNNILGFLENTSNVGVNSSSIEENDCEKKLVCNGDKHLITQGTMLSQEKTIKWDDQKLRHISFFSKKMCSPYLQNLVLFCEGYVNNNDRLNKHSSLVEIGLEKMDCSGDLALNHNEVNNVDTNQKININNSCQIQLNANNISDSTIPRKSPRDDIFSNETNSMNHDEYVSSEKKDDNITETVKLHINSNEIDRNNGVYSVEVNMHNVEGDKTVSDESLREASIENDATDKQSRQNSVCNLKKDSSAMSPRSDQNNKDVQTYINNTLPIKCTENSNKMEEKFENGNNDFNNSGSISAIGPYSRDREESNCDVEELDQLDGKSTCSHESTGQWDINSPYSDEVFTELDSDNNEVLRQTSTHLNVPKKSDTLSECSDEETNQSDSQFNCNNVLTTQSYTQYDCSSEAREQLDIKSNCNDVEAREYKYGVSGQPNIQSSCNDDVLDEMDQQSFCCEEVYEQSDIQTSCNNDVPNAIPEQIKYSDEELNIQGSNASACASDHSNGNSKVSGQLDILFGCSSDISKQLVIESSCNYDSSELLDIDSSRNDGHLDIQSRSTDEATEELDDQSSCTGEVREELEDQFNCNDVVSEQWDNCNDVGEELSTIVENKSLKNDDAFDTCVQNTEHIFLKKTRPPLKRSLSDSALSAYNDERVHQEQESVQFFWPFKRRKINNVENNILAQDLCNIIQSNRRNSISSVYTEDNVSFCILIDNSCIIAEEENEEQEKICYTELTEECLAEIQTHCTNDGDNTTEAGEINTDAHLENSCTYPGTYVDEDEKALEESWVEDVACVETVISDDIAEDIEISEQSSPKDDVFSDNDESGVFSSSEHTDKVKYIYGDKMCNDDAQLVETLYNTPQMDVTKTLVQREALTTGEYYDNDSLEKILSESNDQHITPYVPEYREPVYTSRIKEKTVNNKENMDICISPLQNQDNDLDVSVDIGINHLNENETLGKLFQETQDDTIHSCESSIDNVFTYNQKDEHTNYVTSSSPEVSSTTSEEKGSAILLKITNYKGSRISQINDIRIDSKRPSCKFTEDKDYVQSHSNFPTHRPLLTKAAQKYIPPLKESMRDLKVKLSLPQHSLLKLKQLKQSKDEPKSCKQNIPVPRASKKPKPKFEDVLKSIDEIQFKMHKEKTKKAKKSIPKVVIKKNENGSHYASTSNKDEFNPDLTGRKWQPWVFIEKNHFIDKMAIKKKTKAVYSHRKKTYVLAEKFKKYKSVNSAKFVISPPISDCPSTGLKYTIRLKHNY